jgi:hypothetical protein
VIQNRSRDAMFRETVSSFRESGRGWTEKVRENRSAIYRRDTKFRNSIIKEQLDMRLRNTCSFKVTEKMDSMAAKAKVLSKDFF